MWHAYFMHLIQRGRNSNVQSVPPYYRVMRHEQSNLRHKFDKRRRLRRSNRASPLYIAEERCVTSQITAAKKTRDWYLVRQEFPMTYCNWFKKV